jgi:hypothetical protein
MFQFEDHDLDFKIYRIILLNRRFIEGFINWEGEGSLRAVVTKALKGEHSARQETSCNWLKSFGASFDEIGRPLWRAVEENPKYAPNSARCTGRILQRKVLRLRWTNGRDNEK